VQEPMKAWLMGILSRAETDLTFGFRSAVVTVAEAIDKNKYDVILIGIDKKGRWYLNEASKFLLHADNPKLIKLEKAYGARGNS